MKTEKREFDKALILTLNYIEKMKELTPGLAEKLSRPLPLAEFCELAYLDYKLFTRILRNNEILDENNNATIYGLQTGLITLTDFGTPHLN